MSSLNSKDLAHILETFVFPFYQIERGMSLTFRPNLNENDAEHSWNLSFFALLLTPILDPSLSMEKVLQFCIVHDLVEIYAGDVSVLDQPKNDPAEKEAAERAAIVDIAKNSRNYPWLTEMITQYEDQISPEAIYVKALDKVINWATSIPAFKKGAYKVQGVTDKDFKKAFALNYKHGSKHPATKKLLDEISILFESHPDWLVRA